MSDVLIELRDLVFGYDAAVPLLRRCNFRLCRGERVGLTGPNGSGKSTLLRIAMGLLRPQSGEVYAFGKVRRFTDDDFLEVRRRAGLLFQDVDDQLFCPTVLEDVCFGPLNLGLGAVAARERAREALCVVGLNGFEDRVTFRLSEGEKRLVALAGILAMQPEVVLLDEPLAGLDPAATARVTRLIAELPLTVVLVAHDYDVLSELCTRVVELSAGKIRPLADRGSDNCFADFPAPEPEGNKKGGNRPWHTLDSTVRSQPTR